jgi:hypothetical protein
VSAPRRSRLRCAGASCEVVVMHDWATAFERLVEDHRAKVRTSDGVCAVTFDCAPTTVQKILAAVPGRWVLIEHEERALIDFTGDAVDIELTYELWASDDERAILTSVDHWQAGLLGTLCIYATDAMYQDALRKRAHSASAESFGDPDRADSTSCTISHTRRFNGASS